MSGIEVLIKWKVVHGFYSGGLCRGVELSPDSRTLKLLKRRGGMWRKLAGNEWGILGTREVEWDEEDEIVLERSITDGVFLYVTENSADFQQVAYPVSAIKPGDEIVLDFKVKELNWEYVFIPREGQDEKQIELLETDGLLHFSPMERVVESGKQAWRTVTEEKVVLQEKYSYHLRLLERKVLGSRVLSKNVLFPRPGQFVYAAEGCVRQVVYY